MPPNRFESEVESFLEGSHGDRTHIKRADHPRLHHYAGRYFRRVGSLSGQALPPPMGTPAVPSGPSNVVCFVVLRFGDAPMRVVTNVVNRRCFSCGFLIRCYKRRQSDGFFAENQGFWTQIDDVCNMSTRKGVQIASV